MGEIRTKDNAKIWQGDLVPGGRAASARKHRVPMPSGMAVPNPISALSMCRILGT